jgi:hypothetical protein
MGIERVFRAWATVGLGVEHGAMGVELGGVVVEHSTVGVERVFSAWSTVGLGFEHGAMGVELGGVVV